MVNLKKRKRMGQIIKPEISFRVSLIKKQKATSQVRLIYIDFVRENYKKSACYFDTTIRKL